MPENEVYCYDWGNVNMFHQNIRFVPFHSYPYNGLKDPKKRYVKSLYRDLFIYLFFYSCFFRSRFTLLSVQIEINGVA